ncbi:MAG: thymidine phosphorylase [Trueperaceae bacterium]|nr:MAG: thymidine phosphorylase [Trueperaceae bacterium]
MRTSEFILAKRNGEAHTREELEDFIQGYLSGDIPDYQVSAWLMAVCWRGMSDQETIDLTNILACSGHMLDLHDLPHTVDKHSTGGVGDKTSLVLAPLLASSGAKVAKMSGRGLGHTGGTIDKLESIPGFSAILSESAFLRQIHEIGVVVSGQSTELAPAEGLLYALRNATATVQSLPLIASSIMSKKLAGGAGSLVLDVKVGSGAFLKTREEARRLGTTMMRIGREAGQEVRIVLSNMEEPLGYTVGNTLEVIEAMQCLKGAGPRDLTELCITLAEEVLSATGLPHERGEIEKRLTDGRAYDTFERWISAQGGKLEALETLELAPDRAVRRAPKAGFVSEVEALQIGQAVNTLGGGRSKKGDVIDLGVGIELHAKIGTEVERGDPLATIYHRSGKGLEDAIALFDRAITIAESATPPPLILESLPQIADG